MTSTERWLPIAALENRYEISDHGRIRSVDTFDVWGRIHRGRILVVAHDKRGYPSVRVSVHDKGRSLRIHRLVAIAFVPNPEGLAQVNHKDGVKTNNHWTNLEWVTNGENQRHAHAMGLKVALCREQHPMFKSRILVFDRAGKHVDTFTGNLDMKAKGYDYRNVNACLYGLRKSHRGMTFQRTVD